MILQHGTQLETRAADGKVEQGLELNRTDVKRLRTRIDIPCFQILGSCTIAFGASGFLTALNGGSRYCGSAKIRDAFASGESLAGELIYGIQNMA